MPNPRRTTGQRRRRRHEHVATPEIQKKARQGAKSAAKTVTRAASKVVKATAPSQPSSRGTQTYTQPRNARNRATTPTTNKPVQNKPIQRQVTKPKTPTTQVQKPKLQQTKPTVSYTPKYTPTVTKFGATNAKEQYQEFKTKYKTVAERKAEREADKKKTWKEKQKEYQKAYQKGKDLTYLGTKQKKTETKFKDEKGKTQKLESVNALTKGEFNRMTEASRINNKKLGNLQLKGGKGVGKDIREKVGSKTAESALKGKFATGAMQGLSYVDVFNGVGTYNKAAKKAIKKTKGSGAYLAGYGVGMAGQFALGGTNALGKSIAKTGGKAAAKTAGKKFIRNRAGELVAETPTNIVDAAKMSMDENGKIDKKEFAKWAAINTGFTGGMGGAMEGIGGAITKKQASNMRKLLAKQQAKTITEEETKQLDKVLGKLKTKAKNKESISSNIAEKGLEDKRKILTKSANESAGNVAEKARAGFDARVNENREYQRKLSKIKEAETSRLEKRDTLKAEHDKLQKLLKQKNTMEGHQKIVNEFGSVERLTARANVVESALKKSREQVNAVRGLKYKVNKAHQRATARIDEQFPTKESALEVKGDVKAATEEKGTVSETAQNYLADAKASRNERAELTEYNNGVRERNEARQKEINKLKEQEQQIISDGKKAREKMDFYNGEAQAKADDGFAKSSIANKRLAGDQEAIRNEKAKELTETRNKIKQLESEMETEKHMSLDEPIEGLDDKPRAGNTTVSKGSKKIDDTLEKAKEGTAEPSKVEAKQPKMGKWYKVKRALFNDLEAFDKMATLLPTKEGEILKGQVNKMRMARSTASAKASEGLQIFNDFKLTAKKNRQKLNDFQEYAWLKHDADVVKDDPQKEFLGYQDFSVNNGGETLAALDGRMAELEAKYGDEIKEFQGRLTKYFDDLLDMEVDAGICTEQFAKDLRNKYPNYVPRYVQAEFDGILNQSIKDEIDIGRGLREAKGGKSDYDLVPLYDQMQAKTNAVFKRTELNRTMHFIAAAQGLDVKKLQIAAQEMKATEEETLNALTDSAVFTPKPQGGKHSVWFFDNGVKKEMPISKEMFDEVRNWTGEDRLMLFKGTIAGERLDKALNNVALRKVARGFKDLITDYSIFFGVKNHARDLETALFYTKDLKGFVKYWPKAYKAFLTKGLKGQDDLWTAALDAYKKNGGVYSQLISSGKFDTKFYHSALAGANKLNPFHWVKEINSMLETIPRLAEFMSATEANAYKLAGKKVNGAEFEKYFKQALEDHTSVADSMHRAKDVTLNFDRGGWFGKTLNRGLVPFFNPSMQGLDKLVREIGSSNIRRGAGGSISKFGTSMALLGEATKLGLMVGAPVYLLNEVYGDYYEGKVDGYGALSDYNKYAFYNFPMGDGKYLKIPRARELASMQDVIDYTFHHMKYGDGQTPGSPVYVDTKWKDIKSLMGISWNQIGPVNPIDDNLFMPGYRAFKGETWYGGSVHNFEDEEKIEAGKSNEVYDEDTSWLAKQIGNMDFAKKWNLTPKKVDNALDGYLGILYDFGISQQSAKNAAKFDAGKENGGNLNGWWALAQSAVGSQFTIDSVFQNRYKADNFNRKSVLKKEIEKLESEGKTYSKEWKEANAKLNKINNAFGYNSIQFDETSAQIYLSNDLSGKDKLKATRELAQSQTKMWQAENDGRVTSPVDPLDVVYKMRDSKGNMVLPLRTMLKACSYTSKDEKGNESNATLDAYDAYNGSDRKFMKVTLASRDVNRAAGASTSFMNWRTNAFASVLHGYNNVDDVLEAYGDKNVKYSKRDALLYKQYDGTLKTYKKSSKDITQGAYDLGLPYASKMEQWDKANCLSPNKHIDREYFAQSQFHNGKKNGNYTGYDAFTIMNAARCLVSDKYKKNWNGDAANEINDFCRENEFTYKDGKAPDPKKVEAAIRKKYGSKYSDEERAAVFYEICPWADNPFGEIGDYSLKGDTGIQPQPGGGGGHKRKGHGHGGGGGKGRKTGTVKAAGNASNGTPASGTRTYKSSGKVSTKVASHKVTKHKAKSIKLKSNLDDAYRKRLKKLREEQRKEIAKAHK